jgi:hypothetical protein
VVDDVMVDHVVVDHVMMRMPAGRQCQERRHRNGTRHGRQAKPLNPHVFSSDFLTGFPQPASRQSG